MESNEIRLITAAFAAAFNGSRPEVIAKAPGRVNLIGEHTDYNEGFVFPMALDFHILTAARRRHDLLVKIHAIDYRQTVEFSLDEPLEPDPDNRWSNYPKGVIALLAQDGIKLAGVELAFSGNIPQGAGLSSSAALEVSVAIALQALNGFTMDRTELARLCQWAENNFAGINCGIMDQFVSLMGRKDHALFLDCRSLDYRHVPLVLGEYRVLICHSGVKHSLADSEYNNRRLECETGVKILSRRFPEIKTLRDATLSQLKACENKLDPVIYKRCRHVITENNRVLESVKSLNRNDLIAFGELMNQSHASLRDDYQISCSEIDLLVDFAGNFTGVLGSRITGGGFGGCAVTLISNLQIKDFTNQLMDFYQKETGITPRIYLSKPMAGAAIIRR